MKLIKECEEQRVIKTKLLKIAELGKRIKDIVIGTERGEQQKAEERRMRIALSCQISEMLVSHDHVRQIKKCDFSRKYDQYEISIFF